MSGLIVLLLYYSLIKIKQSIPIHTYNVLIEMVWCKNSWALVKISDNCTISAAVACRLKIV